LASLVDTLDALAATDARNDDATDESMEVEDNISFISYLNGAILLVFSIDCFFDVSLRFIFDLLAFVAPGTFGEEFLYVAAKLITPLSSPKRTEVLKLVGRNADRRGDSPDASSCAIELQ
jgi:hypothetical protein